MSPSMICARSLAGVFGALAFSACATAQPLPSRQAPRSAHQVKVRGGGTSRRACERNAKAAALLPAVQEVLELENIAESLLQCMVTKAGYAVNVEQLGSAEVTGPDSCEVNFTVAYYPSVVRSVATNGCLRTDVSAPVGIVLRGDRKRVSEAALTLDQGVASQANAQIAGALANARFQILTLPEHQEAYAKLVGMIGSCPITGEARVADWTKECRERFPTPAAARDALIAALREAIRATPALKSWGECGGLLLIGGVKLSAEGTVVHAAIDIDYYVLTDDVTFIAPYSGRRSVPVRIDEGLGGEQAAGDLALGILADEVATDAILKLSSYAHLNKCAAPSVPPADIKK
jgi:hypothetical protein